jgi:hypothetical protein
MDEVLITIALDRLRFLGCSVNLKPNGRDLEIRPDCAEEELVEFVKKHFDYFSFFLAGHCDNCDVWTPRRIVSFWGARPHYCSTCLNVALTYFNNNDCWPPVTIPNVYEEAL